MKKLEDYSSMFALTNKWSKDKFIIEMDIYAKEHLKVSQLISNLQDYSCRLNKNIQYFNKRINSMYFDYLQENFTLQPEHKLILQNFDYFQIKDEIFEIKTGYLRENYLKLIFRLNKNEVSEVEEEKYWAKFLKLLNEIPFAIKELSK